MEVVSVQGDTRKIPQGSALQSGRMPQTDNLNRRVLFQAMQKPVKMINVNLCGNTFTVYVV